MTDPIHRVHGMAGNHEAAQWPALTLAEVRAVLASYPALGEASRIVWHSPRPLSAACLVQCAEAMVFIKRHHLGVRTPATLGEEHRFIDHLRARGVPVPEVLRASDGASARVFGNWVYEVHQRAAGIDIHRETISWVPLDNPRHANTAGAMLAQLHNAADGYAAAQRDTHILVARSELLSAADSLAALQDQLLKRPALASYLRQRNWRRELAEVLAPWHHGLHRRLLDQPRLWTHGDWHISNLCWSGTQDDACITSVLDFGLCAQNFALFDLATAIERNAIGWLQLEHGDCRGRADIAQALIAGYRTRRTVDATAIELLADLLPLVHLDFALSEVEYFAAFVDNAKAGIAWDTFLRGHAAWFFSPDGAALLDAIRACA